MNNILYVVPKVAKVSGGPRTRITMFGRVFRAHQDTIIESPGKLGASFSIKKAKLVYVESATNRISPVDFLCLLYLRVRSKMIIVFIRDVYTEFFPEEFRSPRSRITYTLNKLSNLFLAWVSTKMVFPTVGMGQVFFKKNHRFPKRPYFALPPGCQPREGFRRCPDFAQKPGVLYLGGISYANAGFDNFLGFADTYRDSYNFFVLSGDGKVAGAIGNRTFIIHDRVAHSDIPAYIEKHTIIAAFHTRPRNVYDDVTFPIKALDFISFQLPFLTERHVPLEELLGKQYKLFVDVADKQAIHDALSNLTNQDIYEDLIRCFAALSQRNTYEERYQKLLRAFRD